MRKSFIISATLIAAIIISIGIYYYVKQTNKNTSQQSIATAKEVSNEHPESEMKEVVLNQDQYKASNITLGNLEMKNLSEIINANGYTKLPPQNQADVSVYMAGQIKSINVVEGQYVAVGQLLATMQSPEFVKLHEHYLVSKKTLEYLAAEFERQKSLSEGDVNSKKQFQKVKMDFETEKASSQSLEKQISILNINEASLALIVAPISGFISKINTKIGTNAEPGKPIFTIIDNSKMHVDLLVYENDLQKVKIGQNVRFVLTNQNNTEIIGNIFSIGKAFENETKSVAVHADIINDRQMLIPGMYVKALIDIGINTVTALPTEAVVMADGREFIFVLEEETTTKKDEHNHDAHDEHNHEAHDERDEHDDKSGHKEKEYHFQRIEVKTGTSQLGYVQVTPLQNLRNNAKIVIKGTYYIQSHLVKNEGGGGHAH